MKEKEIQLKYPIWYKLYLILKQIYWKQYALECMQDYPNNK